MSEQNAPYQSQELTSRPINGVNYIGLMTLVRREIKRFLAVWMQTIVAPVVTTLLFYAIFALAFDGVAREVNGVSFLQFLAPGLIMMVMVQNAFANTVMSLIVAKMHGNIVDTLMPPLYSTEIVCGYLSGGLIRGFLVGIAALIVMAIFSPLVIVSPAVVILYAVLGSMLLASLGIFAGIWAEKFDHVSAITNFIITPLTFLSGTFYSINALPELWRAIALYNPFFYMIDGFRSGFIGHADGSIVVGLSVLAVINVCLCILNIWLLRIGYKMKD